MEFPKFIFICYVIMLTTGVYYRKKYLKKYAYGMYEGVTMYIADSTIGLVTDLFTSKLNG